MNESGMGDYLQKVKKSNKIELDSPLIILLIKT